MPNNKNARKGDRIRNDRLSFRLPHEMKEELQNKADEEGLTLSDYIYSQLLDLEKGA